MLHYKLLQCYITEQYSVTLQTTTVLLQTITLLHISVASVLNYSAAVQCLQAQHNGFASIWPLGLRTLALTIGRAKGAFMAYIDDQSIQAL